MRSITIKIDGIRSELGWTNISELIKYTDVQRCPLPDRSEDVFVNSYEITQYKTIKKILSHLTHVDRAQVKKIVSVGCGVATTELLLLEYFKNTEIFLIDGGNITDPINDWSELTPEKYRNSKLKTNLYNSWEVPKDAIAVSNIDKNRVHFLDPSDEWPNDVDLIISNYAWCWGFAKENYWDKAMGSLKLNGTLLLDIYLLKDRDIVAEISDELGNAPSLVDSLNIERDTISFPIPIDCSEPNTYWINFVNPNEDGIYGGKYSWIRRK